MLTYLTLTLVIGTFGVEGSQKEYRKSSHVTHSQVRKIEREDSRFNYIPDDNPIRRSKSRRPYAPELTRKLTPIPLPSAPPMYRQESTMGLDGTEWRARVQVRGGGGEAPVQDLDAQVRGMERLEGKHRECCNRSEGQRWPNWLMCFFACCAGRK